MEREPISPEERIFSISDQPIAKMIFDQFGSAGLVKAHGLDHVEGARAELNHGGKIVIISPAHDPQKPGQLINFLPPLDWEKVIALYGSEEKTAAALRKHGFKGTIEFRKTPDNKREFHPTLADIFRTSSVKEKVLFTLAGAGLATMMAGAAYKIAEGSPALDGAFDYAHEQIEKIRGDKD